jgi:hypothetical protein
VAVTSPDEWDPLVVMTCSSRTRDFLLTSSVGQRAELADVAGCWSAILAVP